MMDIKLAIVRKVKACFIVAENHFEKKFTLPKVGFDIRGQDAGRAYFPVSTFLGRFQSKELKTEIKFNPVLLDNNPELFLQQIVAHECAHLIAYEHYGSKIKPHGSEWRSIMIDVFQVEANVTHNLDVSLVANKPYIYRCHCNAEGIALSQRQHKNVNRGSTYLCKRCRSELVFNFEKPSIKKNTADKSDIPILFLYFDRHIDFDQDLADRLQWVLNKNKPQNIISYPNLAENENFRAWLSKNSLLRKYEGIHIPDSGAEASKQFSHCIIFTQNKNILQTMPWLRRLDSSVFLRTIMVKPVETQVEKD